MCAPPPLRLVLRLGSCHPARFRRRPARSGCLAVQPGLRGSDARRGNAWSSRADSPCGSIPLSLRETRRCAGQPSVARVGEGPFGMKGLHTMLRHRWMCDRPRHVPRRGKGIRSIRSDVSMAGSFGASTSNRTWPGIQPRGSDCRLVGGYLALLMSQSPGTSRTRTLASRTTSRPRHRSRPSGAKLATITCPPALTAARRMSSSETVASV